MSAFSTHQVWIIILCAMTVSCHPRRDHKKKQPTSEDSGNNETHPDANNQGEPAPNTSDVEEIAVGSLSNDQQQATTHAANRFGIKALRQLSKDPNENLLISPLSIFSAFAMVYGGTTDETKSELSLAMQMTQGDREFHRWAGQLLNQLRADTEQHATLKIANRLWGQDGFPFRSEFLSLTKNYHQAQLATVDFVSDPTARRDEINQWVSENTNEHIPQLFGPDAIDKDTRLVLANALAFKGDWLREFTKKTSNADFKGAVSTQKVPMMNLTHSFPYLAETGVKIVELPYRGQAVSMIILLPNEGGSVQSLLSTLEADPFASWLDKLSKKKLDLRLPKFEMRGDYKLNALLEQLGAKRLFSPRGAQLFAMFDPTKTDENLSVSKAVHKTFLTVDEKGSEAAAATGIETIGTTSIEPAPQAFHVNRPFLLSIVHRKTKTVLFWGRVMQLSGDSVGH